MTPYTLLLSLHILLIATWLGMDIGLFTSSFWVRNPRLSPETRLAMGRFGSLMDMGPRTSLVLMLGVGILLSYYGGWALGWLPQPVVWLIVLLLLVWLWAIWQQFLAVRDATAGKPLGGRIVFLRQFRTFDLYLRLGLALVMIGLGMASFLNLLGETYGWLNTKFILFGVILLNGVAIRLVSDDFPIALGEIVRLGSTPEREARLNQALTRAYPLVLVLWGLIVVLLVLGVTKPF
ncbi:MAG: hypothetical protein K6U89_12575 [Chloroflexi bacterium]|nr:hypothetical protein [Chloroflexota bacterium]